MKITNFLSKLTAYQKPRLAVPKKVWRNPLYFTAFGFGSGAIPVAPGTFGTLLAIPLYFLLQDLSLFAYLQFLVGFTVLSVWLADRVSNEIGVHDHPGMNIDEFVGYLVTMINAPEGWAWILLGFVLFRFFDIVKPWPINIIDKKVHGGFGMILDDIVAGIFSCIIIQILQVFVV